MKRMVLMFCIVAFTGCRWGGNPYARDPLIQKQQAVPGDLNGMPKVCESDQPAPPGPPLETPLMK